jgi:hypothetical protein
MMLPMKGELEAYCETLGDLGKPEAADAQDVRLPLAGAIAWSVAEGAQLPAPAPAEAM